MHPYRAFPPFRQQPLIRPFLAEATILFGGSHLFSNGRFRLGEDYNRFFRVFFHRAQCMQEVYRQAVLFKV